jgi:hypothetical protein
MFYVIRTLNPSGTRILVSDIHASENIGRRVYGFFTLAEAKRREDCVPGCTTIKQFKNDAEARQYIGLV